MLSREVRDMEVREPLAIASLVDGVCRKMRACVRVTRAIDLCGCSRRSTRIDMVLIELDVYVSYVASSDFVICKCVISQYIRNLAKYCCSLLIKSL